VLKNQVTISALSNKIRDLAKRHGVSPQALLNLWYRKKSKKIIGEDSGLRQTPMG
jgi:transposase-like protein